MGDALPFVSLGIGQTASGVEAGYDRTCAIVTGGVKCWGCAPFSPSLSLPRSLPRRPRVHQKLTIATHSKITPHSRCNDYGVLGLGDTNNRGDSSDDMGAALPFVKLGTWQAASKLALGGYHTCTLQTGGVKCWGYASRALLCSALHCASSVHLSRPHPVN